MTSSETAFPMDGFHGHVLSVEMRAKLSHEETVSTCDFLVNIGLIKSVHEQPLTTPCLVLRRGLEGKPTWLILHPPNSTFPLSVDPAFKVSSNLAITAPFLDPILPILIGGRGVSIEVCSGNMKPQLEVVILATKTVSPSDDFTHLFHTFIKATLTGKSHFETISS
ncbi:hypothetical protein RJT34_05579 [Clitoria ternatea]|uniref:Uncharacterized protein n=1 Tax=Clitoria ternatea TaxID=43366 RepID=A0AAN9K1L0_CLITE